MLDIQDPNALYTAAIANLHGQPEIVQSLGPVAGAVFNAARDEVFKIGAELAQDIGASIAGEIASVIGPAVTAEIAGVVVDVVGVVADLLPVIQMLGAIINIAEQITADNNAKNQAVFAAEATNALSRPVIGSGFGGQILPADIFAPDPDPNPPFVGSGIYSSLGLAFASATESIPTDPNAIYDAPLLHADEALVSALPLFWKGGNPGDSRVGIPLPVRRQLELLRRAMGSHAGDGGASLMPLYLQILTNEFDLGRLTMGYAACLTATYYRDQRIYDRFGPPFGVVIDTPVGSNPRGDGSPGPFAALGFMPLVQQIGAMCNRWRQVRSDPKMIAAAAQGPKLMQLHIKPKPSPRRLALQLDAAGLLAHPSADASAAEKAAHAQTLAIYAASQL